MAYKNIDNSEHWNDYWSQGHQTSFGSAFENGYEGIIKSVWEEYFKTLTSNSRVLDLCTGNASLLRLAKESLNDSCDIKFTGVDYAEIKTEDGFSDRENVELAFSINIESLPFADQSFDYIISNFGIEYSELDKSIVEAARVLKPGGKMNFICHCHDSYLIKSNNQELNMLVQMFKPGDVLDNLNSLISSLDDRKENSLQQSAEQIKFYNIATDKAEEARHKLNNNIANIATSFSKSFHESDFLGFLKYLLSARSGDKQQALSAFKFDLQSHKARLNAMVTAALSNEQLALLTALFADNGLSKFTLNEVVNEEGKIACRISAVKTK